MVTELRFDCHLTETGARLVKRLHELAEANRVPKIGGIRPVWQALADEHRDFYELRRYAALPEADLLPFGRNYSTVNLLQFGPGGGVWRVRCEAPSFPDGIPTASSLAVMLFFGIISAIASAPVKVMFIGKDGSNTLVVAPGTPYFDNLLEAAPAAQPRDLAALRLAAGIEWPE